MGMAQQYNPSDAFFFGEAYTTFNNRMHVTVAARIILAVELIMLFITVVIVPLTIGFFDTISLFQILVCGSIWVMACLALRRHRHALLWPMIIMKVCEIILGVFLIVIAALLAVVRRRVLLRLMQWRITTIDHSNQGIHIIALLLFMFLQIVYNTIAVQTLWDVFEYLRQRTYFIYNQERTAVHQYFL
ncbi:Protein CBG14223 [Caenorhabditis briggsae]|uniref:Uncharacterized protein n=2 Tax=Caenorhabditis briggsae TaxID=6238 RepID=A0AAE8ZQK3_CAEBR|nr:Protein CBG14223 [Caenorhabditis briggsae]ULT81803.1 hypothetical protein L3Y34_011639 [Caenorhabditis briggsae]UMM41108.1 hypothetical protein L5515_017518 [Caenorhabditis briggsae]CAP32822.1 Protein CBG14223 [Caenorhabditis briggsae]